MISCVYCGGSHDRPVDVKQCWADHQGADAEGTTAHDVVASRTDTRPAGGRVPAAVPGPERSAAITAGSTGGSEVTVRRGPPCLGRHVVVARGQDAPAEWADAERIVLDAASPAASLPALREASHDRRSLVIELESIDHTSWAEDADGRPFDEIGPRFGFERVEAAHLIWSNAIDVRAPGHPTWAMVDRATELGATSVAESDPVAADIVLPDGRAAWIDGGPVRYTEPVDGTPVVHAVALEHGSLAPPIDNATTAELAPDQLAAVTHTGGAARIIAPAGSGKTRVLTERVRHVVTRWQMPVSAVQLVAFNKRAQEEMAERTADVPRLQVRTLNAIALAIINGRTPFASQPRSWRTLDDREVRSILSDLVSPRLRTNTDPIAPWIDALGTLRLGLRDPADVEAEYDGDVDGLTHVWPQYRAALERAGAVDFDDQIMRAIGVLLTQPEARRTAQRACRLMLVDEFQDLTPAHLLLVRLLAAPGGAVFGVGDDDQTIYGYNGADPEFLITYADLFPGAGDHPLEVNYRCPGGVVEIADRLLRHNWRRVDKTIRAASPSAGGWAAQTDEDPVAQTVEVVRTAIDEGVTPSDVAVLTRVNAVIAPVQVALVAAGVPISSGVGTEFLDRTAVRATLAWLRIAAGGGGGFAPDDLAEASRRPLVSMSQMHRGWLTEQRSVDDLRRLSGRITQEKTADRIADFADDVERMRDLVSQGATTEALIAALIDEIGLGGAVATLDLNRRGMNASAQGDDLRAVRQLARQYDDPATFGRWVGDHLATRRDPGGVVLATVHRVKGQEWPHVIVHLADADQYPHRLSDDTEEERRLFHVAITRAQHAVTIVSGEQVSPFVAELTTEPPADRPTEPPPRRTASAVSAKRKRSETPDHPLLDRATVLAVPGLVLVDQGQEWTVSELEPEAAVAVQGDATRRFRLGARVTTAGKQSGSLRARPGELEERGVRAFDLLRQFRDRVRNGKPAYTVFDDKTLVAIAVTAPESLADLAQVKGVGPAKLEQYGDDVLTLIAEASAG